MSVLRRLDLGRFVRTPMQANAFALVANQVLSAALGFTYWLLAARLYPVAIVGESSAVISTLVLVSSLSQLGLAGGMSRFVPRAGRHARRMVASAYAVAIVSAAIAGGLWVLLSASLGFDSRLLGGAIHPLWAVLAVVAWSVFYLQDGVLIGTHQAVWVLAENFLYNSLKIILLVLGVGLLGGTGLVASWFLPTPVAILLVSWLVFARFLRPDRVERAPAEGHVTLREFAGSVSGDHVGNMVAEAAVRLLPLIVLQILGPAENAYFYQAWIIMNMLSLVASGMTNSFTAETAANRHRAGINSRLILRNIAVLVVPTAVVVGIAAPFVLSIFGSAYAQAGTGLLRWLALAALPLMINIWYLSYLRVMRRIRRVVEIQVLSSILLIGLTLVGLRIFGIAGVGMAWLITQMVVIAVTAPDILRVLRPGDAISQGGSELSTAGNLRRSDWRFLLPGPAPVKTAVFADGALGASVAALPGQIVAGSCAEAGDCDLCVVEQPDAQAMRLCVNALRPGGICYSEWISIRAGGIRGIRKRLAEAGLEDTVIYWRAPGIRSAVLWLQVFPHPAGYRRVLRRVANERFGSGLTASVASWLLEAMLHNPFIPVVTVARKPLIQGSHPEAPHDFAGWLAQTIAAAGQDVSASEIASVMRTGGHTDENKINWMIFAGSERELRWVAKAPRHPVSDSQVRRERAILDQLASQPVDRLTNIAVPKTVAWSEEPGFAVLVETAVAGPPLVRVASERGYSSVATEISDALATFAGRPGLRPREQWWGALIEPWLVRLERQLAVLGDEELAPAVRRALAGLGELPLVFSHNDCTPWNIMVTDTGLAIFDWEAGEEEGLPGLDLVYCLATTAFILDGTENTPLMIDSYRRLLDPADEHGGAFHDALVSYASAVGVRSEDISRLRIATWLVHTTHNLHNLLVASPKTPPRLIDSSICLPLLRAEMAAFEHVAHPDTTKTPPSGITTADVTGAVIFVSPHLDDAALSCGGGIRRMVGTGAEVIVVTVCTADTEPGKPLSALARESHGQWGLGDTPFEQRRTEDFEAARLLGVRPVHLGMHDAIYRRDAAGHTFYAKPICSPDADDAERFVAALRDRLGRVLDDYPEAPVFCPAGVGGHVDHELVRRGVQAVCGEERIIYYSEYPYSSRPGCELPDPGEMGETVCHRLLVLNEDEILGRVAAVASYRSQLRGLFPSAAERAAQVIYARVPLVGTWILGTANHARSSERMTECLVRDITACGGETYWWPAIEGRTPFPIP
ncbi:MAG: phosphotransferase [Coriobacteriia bacterium]|nr:phosphotransferase [Coriobacteriia bacterium]